MISSIIKIGTIIVTCSAMLIIVIICNYRYIYIYNVGPPNVISWFINPINYSNLRTVIHSYWSYVRQLSYHKRGPALYIYIYIMHKIGVRFFDPIS